jgi:hypothetical protein
MMTMILVMLDMLIPVDDAALSGKKLFTNIRRFAK